MSNGGKVGEDATVEEGGTNGTNNTGKWYGDRKKKMGFDAGMGE